MWCSGITPEIIGAVHGHNAMVSDPITSPTVCREQWVAGGEHGHLTGFLRGGGDMGLCTTTIRVPTV